MSCSCSSRFKQSLLGATTVDILIISHTITDMTDSDLCGQLGELYSERNWCEDQFPWIPNILTLIINGMNQHFVRMSVPDKRADILLRMTTLHDKVLMARNALSTHKYNPRHRNLALEHTTLSWHLNIHPNTGNRIHIQQPGVLLEMPFLGRCQSSKMDVDKKNKPNDDKENDCMSPIKNGRYGSPLGCSKVIEKMGKTPTSPVDLLTRRKEERLNEDENLLEESKEDECEVSFEPMLLGSDCDGRESLNTTKKLSGEFFLSGSKESQLTHHPKFKMSNKYLELSGCQWESACMEEKSEVQDLAPSSNRSSLGFREVSFVPSIFQKKCMRRRKIKANKQCFEILAETRDRVANMIKERLCFNQMEKEPCKKERTSKQSSAAFLHSGDLQKKFKETLIKKVTVMQDKKK